MNKLAVAFLLLTILIGTTATTTTDAAVIKAGSENVRVLKELQPVTRHLEEDEQEGEPGEEGEEEVEEEGGPEEEVEEEEEGEPGEEAENEMELSYAGASSSASIAVGASLLVAGAAIVAFAVVKKRKWNSDKSFSEPLNGMELPYVRAEV
jgi:nucleotide-binding universal stress UspA family protein